MQLKIKITRETKAVSVRDQADDLGPTCRVAKAVAHLVGRWQMRGTGRRWND